MLKKPYIVPQTKKNKKSVRLLKALIYMELHFVRLFDGMGLWRQICFIHKTIGPTGLKVTAKHFVVSSGFIVKDL